MHGKNPRQNDGNFKPQAFPFVSQRRGRDETAKVSMSKNVSFIYLFSKMVVFATVVKFLLEVEDSYRIFKSPSEAFRKSLPERLRRSYNTFSCE